MPQYYFRINAADGRYRRSNTLDFMKFAMDQRSGKRLAGAACYIRSKALSDITETIESFL